MTGVELLIVLIAIVGPAVGYLIGRTKGRPAFGAGLGLILNVVGWAIVAVVPARRSI